MRVGIKDIKLPDSAKLLPGLLDEAIERTLDISATAAKADFGVVTRTWKHKPEFKIYVKPKLRIIYTDHKVFKYIDEGTKVRHALMISGYRAKTRPGQIQSWVGGIGTHGRFSGNPVVFISRKIKRPGIEARKFTPTIQKKWDRQLPKSIQRAIASVVK